MKRGLSLLMILPLFLVMFSNTVNRHRHISSEGIVIEHSHPISPCCCGSTYPGEGHNHTDRELLFYAVMTDAPVVLFSLIAAPEVFRLQEADLSFHHPDTGYFRESFTLSLLRAPPC